MNKHKFWPIAQTVRNKRVHLHLLLGANGAPQGTVALKAVIIHIIHPLRLTVTVMEPPNVLERHDASYLGWWGGFSEGERSYRSSS
jgi:hypothetical protein